MFNDPWFWCLVVWVALTYLDRWTNRARRKRADETYDALKGSIAAMDKVIDDRVRIMRAFRDMHPMGGGAWWKKAKDKEDVS